MQQAKLQFVVQCADAIDESYPPYLQREEIPLYLARMKADAFMRDFTIFNDTVVVTADTIVWIDNRVLGKPAGREDAVHMLETLSGNMHQVYTGVCLTTNHQRRTFFDESKVFFRPLSDEEIAFYVDRYQPYDKAGAYGIQEWIGYIGVRAIEGSFYNVMGLPIQRLYRELLEVRG